MRMFTARIAGLAVLTLLFAAGAFAQGTSGTPEAPTKEATTPAKPAEAKPAEASVKAGGAPRTIVGEVVDPACYLVNGAHGENHKECATACAKAGQTLAILEKKTNKLYLLVTDRPGEDSNQSVLEYIAQTVTIKGRIYSRGGVAGLMVLSVEPGAAKD